MSVDWRLGLAPDVGGSTFNAFMQGQQARQQSDARNALSTYAVDPNPNNLNALAPHNPEFVMQEKQRQAAADEAKAKQAREQLLTISQLFDGVTDEASYQQRMNAARRMGLDVAEAPPNYDPNWVAETGGIFKFFAEKPEAMSTFGKIAADEGLRPGTPEFNHRVVELGKAERIKTLSVQPGGGVATYDPQTGQTNFAIAPNYGQGATGEPAGGGGPAPGAVVGGYRFKGGNPNDRSSWEPMGGASGNAGGGFPVKADFQTFARAIVGQESGGRYGVPNAEGSGAMGLGQIMPDTARVLAKRAGLPYRADLLAGATPEAQDYQNKLTNAALQEAWRYGGGDPEKAAYYYFAGPDRKKWGSKTRQYGVDILRRMGAR